MIFVGMQSQQELFACLIKTTSKKHWLTGVVGKTTIKPFVDPFQNEMTENDELRFWLSIGGESDSFLVFTFEFETLA